MRIVNLIENTPGVEGCLFEHGLSFYIETEKHKILVDAGKSDNFLYNAQLLGRPKGFTISVKQVDISAGAGFVVVKTGNIMTMPGLPKVPAANNIDINNGEITGLF